MYEELTSVTSTNVQRCVENLVVSSYMYFTRIASALLYGCAKAPKFLPYSQAARCRTVYSLFYSVFDEVCCNALEGSPDCRLSVLFFGHRRFSSTTIPHM